MCENCLKKGIECLGYAKVFRWDDKRHFGAEAFHDGQINWRVSSKSVKFRKAHSQIQQNLSASHDITQTIHVIDPTVSVDSQHHDQVDHISTTVTSPDELTGDLPSNKSDSKKPSVIKFKHNINQKVSFPTGQITIDLDGMRNTASFNFNSPPILSTHQTNQLVPRNPLYSMNRARTFQSITRDLLRNYYASTVSPPLIFSATNLVEYYFSTICRLYSCFDSSQNQFRSSVAKIWTSSASTYYAIQSMAAAYLANTDTSIIRQGRMLHQKAADCLVEEISSSKSAESSLMTLLLLGMSACWLRADDLGMSYLRTARNVIQSKWSSDSSTDKEDNVVKFCEEALVYWEMTAAFVSDDLVIPPSSGVFQPGDEHRGPLSDTSLTMFGPEIAPVGRMSHSRITPHAWTGVSPESQILLAQVGRYLRKVRSALATEDEVSRLSLHFEEQLLSLEEPESANVMTPNTENGSDYARDLVTLARITRQCGLLQIYRTCPGILRKRLGIDPNQSHHMRELCQLTRNWLTDYSMLILALLQDIPPSSSVRVHQLLPLTLAACELRDPPGISVMDSTPFEEKVNVQASRIFVKQRLEQLAIQLPARPIKVMRLLVEEIWLRFDVDPGLCDDIFWMDIMKENGWETLMG